MTTLVDKLSPVLWRRVIEPQHGGGHAYLHWCRACGHGHTYYVGNKHHSWQFNGNVAKPSFTPSMHIFMPASGTGAKHEPQRTLCHYFVTDGFILYQPDCPHELKGKTLPLEPIPEDYGF